MSGAAAWTTGTIMASGGIMHHSGPCRRSNPESEAFLISIVAQSQGNCMSRQKVLGLSLHLYKLQVAAQHATTPFLGKDSFLTSGLFLTCHHHHVSSSASIF